RNLHGTTFGGTIFSAADSPLPVMFWQIFAHRGIQVESWLQAAEIHYEKPAATHLLMDISLSAEEVEAAAAELEERGRFRRRHEILAKDKSGQVCARVTVESYVRLPRLDSGGLSAF
ncbi:MAG: YiiD C-terminal domain-containing protein, partial [Planctomycetota bacterium]|nr:YiiD C-terminal domain-containing protein [Planctomycetota bacterium]